VSKLAETLVGTRPGDVRDTDAEIGESSADPALRGKTIQATFYVQDLKRMRLPEVNAAFLDSIGFRDLGDLRDALREVLERRFAYQGRQAMRREILDQLLKETPFDLPRDLVARQEQSTLQSRVQQMREAGLTDDQIRARAAEIRANAHTATLQSLKEFFVLAKIADAEKIEIEDDDIEAEIERIAERTDESPRRVRARIQKEGQMDSLATQILEEKTIDRILEFVKLEDAPLAEETAVATLDQTAAPPGAEEAAEGAEPPEAQTQAEPAPEAGEA
jgi:trigger factor